MTKNVKFKVIKGSLVAATALNFAGVVALSSCSKSKKDDDKNFINVTFNPGEGRIVSGSNTTRLPKGSKTLFGDINKPEVYAKNKAFAGWVIDEDKGSREFVDSEIISNNITVRATYNTAGVDHTILFSNGGDRTIHLVGNSYVSVKDGRFFFMVNKPAAVKEGYTFEYWEDTSGTKILDTQRISADLELVPHFKQTLNISFGQPTAGGVTYKGPQTVKVGVGDTLSQMARPDAYATNKIFSGWCSDAACSTVLDETYVFTTSSPTTLYPKMVEVSSETHTATFAVRSTETSGSIQGNPQVAFIGVEPNNHFENICHPLAIKPGYSFKEWQYEDGTKVNDSDVIANGTTIYAEFTPNAFIYIKGDQILAIQSTSSPFTPIIYPTSLSITSVAWSIDSWSEATDEPTISNDGVVTTYDTPGTLTIKVVATLTDGGTCTQTLTVPVISPFVLTQQCLTRGESGWAVLDLLSACDPESRAITGTYLNGTLYRVQREEFDSKVYIGSGIAQLPDNFLANCPALTHVPEFVSGGQGSLSIGSGFLYGDVLLNEAITLPDRVISIGDDFLGNCVALASPVTLPSQLTSIGAQFMMNCSSFNSALAIPETVTSIGQYFMINNDAFTNTLTLGCTTYPFKNGDLFTFSTSNSEAAHYQSKATVTGNSAAAFKTQFAEADGTYKGETGIYRRYNSEFKQPVTTNIVTKPSNDGFYNTIKYNTTSSDVYFIGSTEVKCRTTRPFYTISRPTAVKEGYKFVCWTTTEDDLTTRVTSVQNINADLTLYPYFEQE